MPPHPTSLRSILLLSSHLCLGLPSQKSTFSPVLTGVFSFRKWHSKVNKSYYQGWTNWRVRSWDDSKRLLNRLSSSYQLNAHFLYSITVYMLHYNPKHVSSSTLLIFRRTNCIITASGIVTLCKRPYSMPVEGGLQSALNRHTVRQEVCIKLVAWRKSILWCTVRKTSN